MKEKLKILKIIEREKLYVKFSTRSETCAIDLTLQCLVHKKTGFIFCFHLLFQWDLLETNLFEFVFGSYFHFQYPKNVGMKIEIEY